MLGGIRFTSNSRALPLPPELSAAREVSRLTHMPLPLSPSCVPQEAVLAPEENK